MNSADENKDRRSFLTFYELDDDRGRSSAMNTAASLQSNWDHLHLRAANDDLGVSTKSPYRESKVFAELILNMLPPEACVDAE